MVAQQKMNTPDGTGAEGGGVGSTLFGDHYTFIRRVSLADFQKSSPWKAATNISVNLASLYNVFLVLAKKGQMAPGLPTALASELKKLSRGLDRVDPKSYAKASTMAGRVFRDYRENCIGSPDGASSTAALVKDFLARNDKAISDVMTTLLAVNIDQRSPRFG